MNGPANAPRPVSDWLEDPYPGHWPDHSYVVETAGSGHPAMVHAVEPSAEAPSGWVVAGDPVPLDLDDWLREAGLAPLAERSAVLSFGSNRCPSKVLRQGGPFVNLVCETSGLAAVWSHGTRGDGQVVATLVGADDHEAAFFCSLCSEDDIALLDVVEGRGTGYDLVPVDPSHVVLEDGSSPEQVSAYVGLHPDRWPVAGQDGSPVLLTDMTQDEVAAWRERAPAYWEHDPETRFRPLGD